MQAFADHGEVEGDKVSGTAGQAQSVLDRLAALGIDYDDVVDVLENEGVEKFDTSWDELVETVQTALDDAKQGKPDPGSSKAGDNDAGAVRRDPRPASEPASGCRRTGDFHGSPGHACW